MISLESCFRQAAHDQHLIIGDAVEPFARLQYQTELAVKKAGVKTFCSDLRMDPSIIDDVVAAPLPRGYRSTSRRRLEIGRSHVRLTHGDGSDSSGASPLEPSSHGAIYITVEKQIEALPPMISAAINHVILRGTYDELVLIINVRGLDARIVRALRIMAERVRDAHPSVQHAWIFHDPKGSRYYLDLERPASGVGAKKIFGAAAWKQDVHGITYQVGVFSFTQVNLAMVPTLVDVVRSHAKAEPTDVVYDLYCGYGLFGAALAKQVERVIAVDGDESSVDNARYSIRRAGGQVLALREVLRDGNDMAGFVRSVSKILKRDPAASSNVVVLDPPRSGTPERLISAIAGGLEPKRVVEIFCGSDEIYRSTREWKHAGYVAKRVTPVDLFPGTMGMEFVVTYEQGSIDAAPAPNQRPQRSGGRWSR